MQNLPTSFLKLDQRFRIEELNRHRRDDFFNYVLQRADRYRKLPESAWNGLFRIHFNGRSLLLTQRESHYQVERIPTLFPLFDPDMWTQHFAETDIHFVACLSLKAPIGRFLIRRKKWLEKSPVFRSVEVPGLFSKSYRLWFPKEVEAPVMPPEALLAAVASRPKLAFEAFEKNLLIEWPFVESIFGVKKQGDPFCDFCFDLMGRCTGLFE